MDAIVKYYYLVEFEPHMKGFRFDLEKDFPGFSQALAGSKEFTEYEDCIHDCVAFLQGKLDDLKQNNPECKIYWTKNRFNPLDTNWEKCELAKIYISSDAQHVYNGSFRARVFFSKEEKPQAYSFVFDQHPTLQ